MALDNAKAAIRCRGARAWVTFESGSLDRFGHSASSSSKKITHGALARARENTRRTASSLSPTYLFSSSGPLMLMKFAPLSRAVRSARRGRNRRVRDGIAVPCA